MDPKTSILLIEDDKSICSFISTALTGSDYKVTCAATGSEGVSLAASNGPHIILLDLGLPDMDGLEVLKQVRSWSHVPIIIISARSKETDKVTALDMGADDYLTKPFGTAELTARIRAALRHYHQPQSGRSYRSLDLEVDFEKRLVLLRGEQIHLTQIEYQLLSLLAENSGKVMTYSSIMNTIWGPYMDSDNQILRVNMANIRRKLETNPARPVYVFTEVGVGYRMRESDNH